MQTVAIIGNLGVEKQDNTQFSTTYAKTLGWSDEEVKIYELNYRSAPIGGMNGNDVIKHSKILLFKISVITGWNLPSDELLLNVLYDQFRKKMQEDYSSLNVDEIEYAMRSLGTTVKDWGKNINLSLIDEVLIPYISKRAAVREMENHAIKPAPQLPGIAEWKEQCEHYYQQYRKGTVNMDLWPVEMYDEFVKAGFMEADLFEEFKNKARQFLINRKHTEINEAKLSANLPLVSTLNVELDLLIDEDNEVDKATKWSKRFAILKLYYMAKENGYANLFVKE